ncbi:hypothetical protein V6N12_024278 [Hibiscus sabdariffa]|uniref:RNase H type-1 domain-containing protein n=1 Tax=Hibiscus sabdariffa TaxID=183260 RepID=A0ABR2G0X8_9ROSI
MRLGSALVESIHGLLHRNWTVYTRLTPRTNNMVADGLATCSQGALVGNLEMLEPHANLIAFVNKEAIVF